MPSALGSHTCCVRNRSVSFVRCDAGGVTPIEFRSDNAAPAADYVLEAIGQANIGAAPAYGGDQITAALQQRVSEVFGREARVFPVLTGTAANALGLAAMCPPWGAVICHEVGHILTSEAAATSAFGGGIHVTGLPGAGSLLDPETVSAHLEGVRWDDPHESQPRVLSVTQATELGAVYPLERIAALATVAADRGMTIHLDGARLANAIATLGVTPAAAVAEATTFTLGATKNGLLSTDAIVTFDDRVAAELGFRLKRAGQVASKMRFASAQLLAYLERDRWLDSARHANAALRRLADGVSAAGFTIDPRPQANIAFVEIPDEVSRRWADAEVLFHTIAPGRIRLVTSFATTDSEVDDALDRLRAVI